MTLYYCLQLTDPAYYTTILAIGNILQFLCFFLPSYIDVQISANIAVVIVAVFFPTAWVPSSDVLMLIMNISLAAGIIWIVQGLKETGKMVITLLFFGVVLAAVTSNIQTWLQLQLHLLISNIVIVIALLLCMVLVGVLVCKASRAEWLVALLNAAVSAVLLAASVNFFIYKWSTNQDCPMPFNTRFVVVAVGGVILRFGVEMWWNKRQRRAKLKKEMDKERRRERKKKAEEEGEDEPLLVVRKEECEEEVELFAP